MATASDLGSFDVEDIIDHRFNRKAMRTEFNVKWEGWEKEHNSWEPLESVYKCPVLIENMEKRKRAALVKTIFNSNITTSQKEGIIRSLPRFKVLSAGVTNKLKDPKETVPKGNESFGSLKSECLSTNKDDILWKVYFNGALGAKFVRKSVMSYYWPVESALFLTLLKHRETCLDNYLAELDS